MTFLTLSRRLLAAAFAIAIPSVVNIAGDAARAATVTTVEIKNFAFMPAVLTVAPGTIVTWINADEDPHTVTANDKGFHSSGLDTGGRFSVAFTKTGEFAYFCSLHPHMTARVIVKVP